MVSVPRGRGVRENGNALLALHADRRYELILDASCITGESAATHNNKTTRSPDNRLVKRSDPGLVKLQATRRAGRCRMAGSKEYSPPFSRAMVGGMDSGIRMKKEKSFWDVARVRHWRQSRMGRVKAGTHGV